MIDVFRLNEATVDPFVLCSTLVWVWTTGSECSLAERSPTDIYRQNLTCSESPITLTDVTLLTRTCPTQEETTGHVDPVQVGL